MRELALKSEAVTRHLAGKTPTKIIFVKDRMLSIVASAAPNRGTGSVCRPDRPKRPSKKRPIPPVVVLGRLRSMASFVPTKIISTKSRCRPISGEPSEYKASWRLTIAYV